MGLLVSGGAVTQAAAFQPVLASSVYILGVLMDKCILPVAYFSAILGIKCCNTVTDDWDNVSHHWRINEVTPMGANIQIVFYRSKRSDDILVKILHNEREQILDSSVATPVESVFYRWSDIRSHLLSQIK